MIHAYVNLEIMDALTMGISYVSIRTQAHTSYEKFGYILVHLLGWHAGEEGGLWDAFHSQFKEAFNIAKHVHTPDLPPLFSKNRIFDCANV